MQKLTLKTGQLALATALVCAANPVWAQDEAEATDPMAELGGVDNPPPAEEGNFPVSNAPRVYYPEDFAQFAPRNALDLVQEIPGLNIQGGGGFGGGGGGRGFGEASGNLLINGDRITSKSTSTRDELSRISVANVVRIEVVDGSTLEIPGLSGRVANVIVRETSSISGQFSWRPRYSTGPGGFNFLQGNVSVRGSTGDLSFTIAADMGGFKGGQEGTFDIIDANGVVDQRYYFAPRKFRRPTITGIFSLDITPDVKANLNLSYGLTRFRTTTIETRTELNPLPALEERFGGRNNEYNYEIGGDIEFPLGPGRLKLIGLESYQDGEFISTSLFDQEGRPLSGSQFGRSSQTGERIGRAEYAWRLWGADWQLSAEAAFNRLDQQGSLAIYDPNTDEFIDFPFPAGSGGVTEDRYESILSYSRPLTDKLSMQLQIGGEYSTISQTGTNALSRTFQRPKGTLTLAWSPTDTFDASFELARRVGQLNFGDFLASVNLTDDNEDAGNNQLRPQQSWEAEIEFNKTFGAWGNATISFFRHEIEDLLIVIPVEGGEARGNLESASRHGARFNGRLELGALGWEGAKIDATLSLEDSSLEDPVTGNTRRFDGANVWFWRADFRHDVPGTNWAYGVAVDDSDSSLNFRTAERTFSDQTTIDASFFVENKDVFGLTVRFNVGNLFDRPQINDRFIFDRPRGPDALLIGREFRRTFDGRSLNLSISGSF